MSGIMSMVLGAKTAIAAAVDEFFNRVTLLLPGNGTNGAQNNTFLDSSSNAFSITRNGNTTQGTFSPFSQTGWSNYISSGNKLSAPAGTSFAYGTGAFTIEAYIYIPSTLATNGIIFSQTVSGTNYLVFQVTTTNQLSFIYATSGGGTQISSSASAIPLGQWTHVAAVRVGTGANQFYLYVNGVNVATSTVSQDFSSTTYAPVIGDYGHTTQLPFVGYISNVRVTKGGALYTGAFTPSTTPLTTTVSAGTVSLLTCQSNRFVDNSSNSFAITVTGTPSVQAFSPFAPTASYDASSVGGSGYFDGTGDYLTMLDNSSFNIGSNSFSVELWYYAQSTASERRFISQWNTSNKGIILTTENQTPKFYYSLDGATDNSITSSTTPAINQWNHLIVCRSGSTLSMFLNGSRVATTTQSGTFFNSTETITIGSGISGAVPMAGHISGLRSIVGSSQYDPTQTTITIPTAPPTAITNTSLLLNFTNAGITDATAKNVLETVGNAQISTTQSKFGGSSMYFDGTGDYLKIPSNQLFAFGAGDFTIEFWARFNTVSTAQTIFDFRPDATGTSLSPYLEITPSGTITYFFNGGYQITTSAVSANTWYHVALVRNGANNRIYIDGTQSGGTFSNSSSLVQSGIVVGMNRNNGGSSFQYLNAYLDDFRISNFARYTANFTAPTSAFPVQ